MNKDNRKLYLVPNQDKEETLPTPIEERRAHQRRQVYLAEGLDIVVHTTKGSWRGQCIDLSPEGVAVVFPAKMQLATEIGPGAVQVEVTTPVASSLTLGGEIVGSTAIAIQGEDYHRISISLKQSEIGEIGITRRIGVQFPIQEFLQPQAFADDPLFLSDPMLFRLASLGRKGGCLLTSARNKSLIPGIPITLTILLPNLGELTVECVPLRIRRHENRSGVYLVDIEFEEVPPKLAEAISEFLLMSSPGLSLEVLRSSGFFVAKMEKAISVSSPRSESEMRAILALRLSAYHGAGKFTEKSTAEEMRDRYDQFSRQIACRIGGEIVGAIRLVFCGKELARSEHHQLGVPIPQFILDGGFIELSRACTHPSFRGSDIMITMIRHATRIAFQSGIKYFVANCNAELWPMYRRLGAKKIGRTFTAFGRSDCQLIYFEPYWAASTIRGEFLASNQLLVPVNRYLDRFRSPAARAASWPRVMLHRLLFPIIRFIARTQAFRKFRKKNRTKYGKTHSPL